MVPDGARDLAISTAREAGAILRGRLGHIRDVQFKGTIDLVTDVDRASEAVIAGRIRGAFPDHRFIGEEGARGAGPNSTSPYGWVVDPLDGTTNYAHGYPHFAVSIGLERGGVPILGVVYDPMRDELFVGEHGCGATLNGAPIAVSGQADLLQSLLATGFPYDPYRRAEAETLWSGFLFETQGVRRDGSAALNLCWVAAGRLDGFYERPLQPWDMAAGAVMITEAGGRISQFDGAPFQPYELEMVASNGVLHERLLEVIARRQSAGQ
ncbi:MAG TPA: inositol monophosphatase family protein [Thermomicrobiales bacterium]|nr:inositol monophosphatase family protein [Thermomicrobiales bacterium]